MQGLRDRLADAGINDGLMYKAARNKPQTWFNKAVAAIRAAVERRFGIMKRGYGFRRVRYIGLSRNACHLQLLCTRHQPQACAGACRMTPGVCPEQVEMRK